MKKIKILIVEDEYIISLTLKNIFVASGYDATVVTSGAEAITYAEKEKPDVVIMDVSLNGQLDGIEAARMIKAKFGLPIIFMTGYSSDDLREKANQIGPIGYFVKPVDNDELLRIINTNIQKL
jgi:CheY-like chemotaxis protein